MQARGDHPVLPPYDVHRALGRRVFSQRLLRTFQNRNIADAVYDVSIVNDQWDNRRMIDMRQELTRMWTDLLDHVKQDFDLLPSDSIRIHIDHRELRHGSITLSLRPLREMTPEAIVDYMSMILQSHEHLMFGDIMETSVGVIRFQRGEGQKKLQDTSKEQLKDKRRAIEYIDNDDKLCLARSLVIARGYEDFMEKRITEKAWRWLKVLILFDIFIISLFSFRSNTFIHTNTRQKLNILFI